MNNEPQAREKFLLFSEAYAVLGDDRQRCVGSASPFPFPLPLPLLLVAINSREKVQTDIRPFSRRLRRATIGLLSATPYILSLRDGERVTAAKRELCLGAPPPSSPGPESESTRTLPTPIPFSPPSADIVAIVAICLERSLLSPGDTGPHTSLPPVTYGLERDGIGPCQSCLWTCEGSATCRTLHRCRCRWHSGEKLSENRCHPFQTC